MIIGISGINKENNSEVAKYFEENNFKVIEKMGKSPLGGDILRATYTNSNKELMQGLFTASVKSIGKYYINTDIYNLNSKKIQQKKS